MTPFEWVDRYGVLHQLSSPEPIDDEAEAISQEIDKVLVQIENTPPAGKSELRLTIRKHDLRLKQLQTDANRWTRCAYDQLDIDADTLAEHIDKLLIEVQDITIVAVLHQEHEEVMSDIENRDLMLAGQITKAQRMAVARSTLQPKPGAGATRRQAHEWLKGDPVYYRPRTDEGGWFEWLDSEGVMHRLASPRRIEGEIATIVNDLRKLSPALRGKVSQNDKARAFETANSAISRLSLLQVDLERFGQEQDEREEVEWQTWETEWKRLRTKQ